MKLIQNTLAQIRRLERFVDRPWYPFVLAGLTFIDFFVVFVPSDGIVVASTLARPKKWFLVGFSMTMGSLLGGLLMALLTKHYGEPFIDWMSPGLLETQAWHTSEMWVDRWGVWALFGVAVSPLAQQPSIMLAALADMPLTWIGVALGGGRLVKFLGYAWVASHAPRLIGKLPALQQELQELHQPDEPPAK
jgi:membrane protein YqaA with SNARE-associated domain